ncbi:MAG TPA: FadR/GntR family transcriptional regulator [Solirubrobacterales bacterium]|nr:FadR/GntR family transcriptional regulator [Solirubrobacterales bacterium]
MSLRPSAAPTITSDVIEQLEAQIAAGTWAVGDRLPPEPELAETLQVGRNTVREAVRALAYAGLVDVRRGDGTYVVTANHLDAAMARRVTTSRAADALEVRSLLEIEAAGLAAERRDDADMELLEDALASQEEARSAGDLDHYIEADLELHRRIVASTHNPVLTGLYESLDGAVRSVLTAAIEPEGGDLPEPHHAIVGAIERRDPAAARAAAAALLADAARLLDRE